MFGAIKNTKMHLGLFNNSVHFKFCSINVFQVFTNYQVEQVKEVPCVYIFFYKITYKTQGNIPVQC